MGRAGLLLIVTAVLLSVVACSSPGRDDATATPTGEEIAAQPTLAGLPAATATLEPTATPSPPATATPSPTSSPTPSPTPEPTETPTPEPPTLAITGLQLHDIDGSPLQFLSIDAHDLFGGFTPIHGTLAIEGEGEIASVALVITDAATGTVVETGLLPGAVGALPLPLGADGRAEVATSQMLFQIPSDAFGAFDRSTDGYVELAVRATATDGREAVYQTPEMREIGKLVLYTADNRYFVGEEEQGGNSWTRPDTRTFAGQISDVTLGDFSNLNGGPFPPHVSHQTGLDFDAWFFGYNERDAAAAQGLLDRLNHPGIIERIDLVFITYEQIDGNPFWDAIRDVTLVDGRPAAEVFLPGAGHEAHFHVRLWE